MFFFSFEIFHLLNDLNSPFSHNQKHVNLCCLYFLILVFTTLFKVSPFFQSFYSSSCKISDICIKHILNISEVFFIGFISKMEDK